MPTPPDIRAALIARLRAASLQGGLYGPAEGWAPPQPATDIPAEPLLAAAEAEGVEMPVASALLSAAPDPAARAALYPRAFQAQARAGRLAAALGDVTAVLGQAGVESAALKGAAFLTLSDPPPNLRDMQDIDLLVRPADLPRAVEALREAGWTGDHDAFVPTDYHYPALFPPGGAGPATVELHARLDWRDGGPLAAEALLARAEVGAGGVKRLSAPDRAAHLIRHAQLADRRFARGTARLRDLHDWRLIAADPAARDGAAVAALAGWDGRRARAAAEGFLALAALVWGGAAPTRAAADWAARALATVADPEAQAAAAAADLWHARLEVLRDGAQLKHLAAGLMSKGRRKRFLSRLGMGAKPDPRGE